MSKEYQIITLCGSTRFKEDFLRIQKELTLAGFIVISVGCFGHSGDVVTEEQKIMLDDMHKRKIDMANFIIVINTDGYIGESTRSEIEYARCKGIPVLYKESLLYCKPLERIELDYPTTALLVDGKRYCSNCGRSLESEETKWD